MRDEIRGGVKTRPALTGGRRRKTLQAGWTKWIGSWLLLPAMVIAVSLAGCKKNEPAPVEPATAASGPAAAALGSGAPAAPEGNQPAAGEAAPAPPPPASAQEAQAPPPPPPPPAPKTYDVPQGTRLTITTSQTISTKANDVGDSFTGRLAQSVRVHGVVVLKAGIPVSGTVVQSKGRGRFKGAGDLAIQLDRVGRYRVSTGVYGRSMKGKGKRSTAMIGGGGGGGALIGALAGGGKGALIGGLIGAGAGTAGAAFTGNANVEIPAESAVTFRLTASVQVTP